MQYTKEKLAAQQLVLFHLGFYKGLVDGIWSTSSIQAKKTFEADPSFVPANPNGGLPFGERERLPKGMRYENGLIVSDSLTPERAAEIMSALDARKAASQPKATAEVQPRVEEVPSVEATESVEVAEVDLATKQESEEGKPEHRPNHKHNHGKKHRG